ncbi:MAG: type II toxin-antitoxin system VapC family toxin [Oscillospiraceae bacterium]|nr:type II toxin-antitoxin system VapC family toxin [Oscillospiraceae bacterium]
MNSYFVLDACALVAVLNREDGADKVMDVYKKAENGEAKIIINRVNLLEVYYSFYHAKGKEYAEKVVDAVTRSIIEISEFDRDIFPIAGRLKASYRISLADSIALGQAIVSGGELITCDHHEFDSVTDKDDACFYWIR